MKLTLPFACKTILFLGLFVGCSSAPKVLFKDAINTKTKPIRYQDKKTFTFAS